MIGFLRSAAGKLRRFAARLYFGRSPAIGFNALDRTEAEMRRTGGALEAIFFAGDGRLVHKWIDYLPIYERFFAPYRGSKVRMLEIGVSQGGSLDMWRSYFGPDASIYGIDIDPKCATRVSAPNVVRIGSQDDLVFLTSVLNELGTPDIILDDGSHVAEHQRASFLHLWPKLRDGGLYVIEDLHTAYWSDYNGGYRRKGTAVEMGKCLVDDMNGWFHTKGTQFAPTDELGAVLFFESMIIVEKRKKVRPGNFKSGGHGEQ